MTKEIERKFLLANDDWKSLAQGILYRQGYLSRVKNRTVRVRTVGNEAFLTIKGLTTGVTRTEFEYPIPFEDSVILLKTLVEKPLIEKKRYTIPFAGCIWEIDEFLGENTGLVLAEIELESEDQEFTKPLWVGEEVSDDPRYFNANLVKHPFTQW